MGDDEQVTGEFERELAKLINKHSLEGVSDTPDFILARHLCHCLGVFNASVKLRNKWYALDKALSGAGKA